MTFCSSTNSFCLKCVLQQCDRYDRKNKEYGKCTVDREHIEFKCTLYIERTTARPYRIESYDIVYQSKHFEVVQGPTRAMQAATSAGSNQSSAGSNQSLAHHILHHIGVDASYRMTPYYMRNTLKHAIPHHMRAPIVCHYFPSSHHLAQNSAT